ncbi:MAG TPA: hypothetical protein VHC22_30935 [Pirellulales bacterium]|nr:hypothetical protein [Pirellulales bacterium]
MFRLSLFLLATSIAAFQAESVLAKGGHPGGHGGAHHPPAHHGSAHHPAGQTKGKPHTDSAKHASPAAQHAKSHGKNANEATPSAKAPQNPENSPSTTTGVGGTSVVATTPGTTTVVGATHGRGLTGSRGYHRGYGNSYRRRSYGHGYAQGRPSFIKGPDQTVAMNSGPSVVNPWATIVSARSNGAGGGSMRFQVTADSNPALFSQAPTVSSTGALSFTPAAGQSGMATLTVILRSSGGNSAPQSFHITVKPA